MNRLLVQVTDDVRHCCLDLKFSARFPQSVTLVHSPMLLNRREFQSEYHSRVSHK